MLRLSIVIPCADGAEHFEDTLVSVLQNRPKGSEVLVVQPHPYDDPYDLCGEVRFIEADSRSSLVELINVGLRAARSEIVHLLSCDARVDDGWSDAAITQFKDKRVASVSPLLVELGHRQRAVTTGIDFGVGGELIHRNRAVAVDQIKRQRTISPTLHAAFYRRQAILDAQCFRPGPGLLTPVDMALHLRSQGFRHVVECDSQVMLSRRWKHPLSLANGKQVEHLFWRHAASRGWVTSLLVHPAAVAAETFRHLYRPAISLQVLGRLLTLVDVLRGQAHHDDPAATTVLKYKATAQNEPATKRVRRAA